MIASIPAEDRPDIIRQPMSEDLAQAMNTFRIEFVHHVQNVVSHRFGVLARAIRNGGPLTCLSCGAKTQPDGSLPCGH